MAAVFAFICGFLLLLFILVLFPFAVKHWDGQLNRDPRRVCRKKDPNVCCTCYKCLKGW